MSEAGESAGTERLALADWRRRIADLYAEVRRMASADPHAAWRLWGSTRETMFREHPQSPVPAAQRASFEARHWAYDEALRFALPVLDEPPERRAGIRLSMAPGATLRLPMSVGEALDFRRIGWVEVPFRSGPRRLALYWMTGYAGGLFLPFRDATNGTGSDGTATDRAPTYAAGRYLLDAAKGADLGADAQGRLIVDFNFAFHPSCAFDPIWSCPLAPPENRLDLPIEAGERLR